MSLAPVRNPFARRRRPTREVKVGTVGVGGMNPLRVQSMTTTDTQDTEATVAQSMRLAEAGCEIVRITAPSIRDAEKLAKIKATLLERGCTVPLVADIHFTPNAAMEAALHVEKVRVNPGNYADKKRFEVREYSDAEYADEIARVQERFRPLVLRCKELGRAMRIGTNHGSLSDRIMNRFGDTPDGMVESALEFLAVCEAEDYRDVVFSMKASNPQVAIHAYRLLAARLAARDGFEAPSYPFHLGVTEAGDGDDGRVKSAIGIGALLEDGIGDTIRVSLTEDPVKEIPVARALAARYDGRAADPDADAVRPFPFDPVAHQRRVTVPLPGRSEAFAAGAEAPVRVELDLGPAPLDADDRVAALQAAFSAHAELACEGLSVDADDERDLARVAALREALGRAGIMLPLALRVAPALAGRAVDLADRVALRVGDEPLPTLAVPTEWCLPADAPAEALVRALQGGTRPALVSIDDGAGVHGLRAVVARLAVEGQGEVPIALRHRSDPLAAPERAVLDAAIDFGSLLCDGIGDLVVLGGLGSPSHDLAMAYRILQGARQRTSWTEFISCPSCGRTLFDLEETTARIKERTDHLPGLKIAVMGCIVNGPGEMADADFGYVGSGPGTVNLYVGHDCVVRNVPEDAAPERLVDLIRDHGRWVERS